MPNKNGASAVEFVLILPVLLLAIFAIIQFGIALNNYIMLSDATRVSSRTLAISRGSTGTYTAARNAFNKAAAGLNLASVTLTVNINGVSCATDAACDAIMNSTTTPTMGLGASVRASYPCDLRVMGVDFAPNCKISSQITERIE